MPLALLRLASQLWDTLRLRLELVDVQGHLVGGRQCDGEQGHQAVVRCEEEDPWREEDHRLCEEEDLHHLHHLISFRLALAAEYPKTLDLPQPHHSIQELRYLGVEPAVVTVETVDGEHEGSSMKAPSNAHKLISNFQEIECVVLFEAPLNRHLMLVLSVNKPFLNHIKRKPLPVNPNQSICVDQLIC